MNPKFWVQKLCLHGSYQKARIQNESKNVEKEEESHKTPARRISSDIQTKQQNEPYTVLITCVCLRYTPHTNSTITLEQKQT
jgi:hypothetical protein